MGVGPECCSVLGHPGDAVAGPAIARDAGGGGAAQGHHMAESVADGVIGTVGATSEEGISLLIRASPWKESQKFVFLKLIQFTLRKKNEV